MDLIIIISSTLGTLIFVLLHALLFRRVESAKTISRISYLFIFVAFLLIFSLLIIYIFDIYQFKQIPFTNFIIACILSLLLFGLMAMIYIFCLFGIIESSIRIRVLEEIGRAGRYGLKKDDFLRIYNTDIILKKRLKRFISDGDIEFQKGYYILRKRFSFILLPTLMFMSFWIFYRGAKRLEF